MGGPPRREAGPQAFRPEGRVTDKAAATLGRKGGKKKGATKRRGDAAYYRDLAAKSAAKRKKPAIVPPPKPKPRVLTKGER